MNPDGLAPIYGAGDPSIMWWALALGSAGCVLLAPALLFVAFAGMFAAFTPDRFVP